MYSKCYGTWNFKLLQSSSNFFKCVLSSLLSVSRILEVYEDARSLALASTLAALRGDKFHTPWDCSCDQSMTRTAAWTNYNWLHLHLHLRTSSSGTHEDEVPLFASSSSSSRITPFPSLDSYWLIFVSLICSRWRSTATVVRCEGLCHANLTDMRTTNKLHQTFF